MKTFLPSHLVCLVGAAWNLDRTVWWRVPGPKSDVGPISVPPIGTDELVERKGNKEKKGSTRKMNWPRRGFFAFNFGGSAANQTNKRIISDDDPSCEPIGPGNATPFHWLAVPQKVKKTATTLHQQTAAHYRRGGRLNPPRHFVRGSHCLNRWWWPKGVGRLFQKKKEKNKDIRAGGEEAKRNCWGNWWKFISDLLTRKRRSCTFSPWRVARVGQIKMGRLQSCSSDIINEHHFHLELDETLPEPIRDAASWTIMNGSFLLLCFYFQEKTKEKESLQTLQAPLVGDLSC